MLEETWGHDTLHEGLAQYLLPDFILGNSGMSGAAMDNPVSSVNVRDN